MSPCTLIYKCKHTYIYMHALNSVCIHTCIHSHLYDPITVTYVHAIKSLLPFLSHTCCIHHIYMILPHSHELYMQSNLYHAVTITYAFTPVYIILSHSHNYMQSNLFHTLTVTISFTHIYMTFHNHKLFTNTHKELKLKHPTTWINFIVKETTNKTHTFEGLHILTAARFSKRKMLLTDIFLIA